MQTKEFRKPKNPAEADCWDYMTRRGFKVTKRGWPDFFCWRDDEVMIVEVKPRGHMALKPRQMMIMKRLARYGVPCYRWSPEDGLVKV